MKNFIKKSVYVALLASFCAANTYCGTEKKQTYGQWFKTQGKSFFQNSKETLSNVFKPKKTTAQAQVSNKEIVVTREDVEKLQQKIHEVKILALLCIPVVSAATVSVISLFR